MKEYIIFSQITQNAGFMMAINHAVCVIKILENPNKNIMIVEVEFGKK